MLASIPAVIPSTNPELIAVAPQPPRLDVAQPLSNYSIFGHGKTGDDPVLRAVTGNVFTRVAGHG